MDIRPRLGVLMGRPWALAAVALLLIAPASKAEIVANFGTLSQTQSGQMSCGTQVNSCTGTPATGSYGGQLPGVGSTFTHQIVFTVGAESVSSSLASVLDSADFAISNFSVALYAATGGATTVGGTATHGAALATAISQIFGGSTLFRIDYGNLQAGTTYVLEIIGGGPGVRQADANYSQLVNIFAVPLPPAVLLLAVALAGLIGFSRLARNSVKA